MIFAERFVTLSVSFIERVYVFIYNLGARNIFVHGLLNLHHAAHADSVSGVNCV